MTTKAHFEFFKSLAKAAEKADDEDYQLGTGSILFIKFFENNNIEETCRIILGLSGFIELFKTTQGETYKIKMREGIYVEHAMRSFMSHLRFRRLLTQLAFSKSDVSEIAEKIILQTTYKEEYLKSKEKLKSAQKPKQRQLFLGIFKIENPHLKFVQLLHNDISKILNYLATYKDATLKEALQSTTHFMLDRVYEPDFLKRANLVMEKVEQKHDATHPIHSQIKEIKQYLQDNFSNEKSLSKTP